MKLGLRSSAWWLLVISGVVSLSVGLSNTFVNVYLWKIDRSYIPIGWYNFSVYCAIPITFIAAGWVAKHWQLIWSLRIGLILHGLFYALVLIGGRSVARSPAGLGVALGVAAGFYWLAFNQLSLQVTDESRRDRFYGLNGVMGAVAGMVAPPLAGYFISKEDIAFGGLTGYHLVFGASLVLFVLAGTLSSLLRLHPIRGQLRLQESWVALRQRSWRVILLGCMVYGLREGVFIFLIGLLMYVTTGSEMRLGEFLFLQGFLSFVSYFAVSRWTTPKRRPTVMGIGAVGLACAAGLFLLPLTARLVLWYGALAAAALPLFLVSLQGYVSDTIGGLSKNPAEQIEHIIAREAFENFGRILGIGIFLFMLDLDKKGQNLRYLALVLGGIQLLTWTMITHEQKGKMTKSNKESRTLTLRKAPLVRSGVSQDKKNW